MIAKTWALFQWTVAVLFLTLAPGWALYKYSLTGDGKWFLTVIGAPIMGLMIVWVGAEFWRIGNEKRR